MAHGSSVRIGSFSQDSFGQSFLTIELFIQFFHELHVTASVWSAFHRSGIKAILNKVVDIKSEFLGFLVKLHGVKLSAAQINIHCVVRESLGNFVTEIFHGLNVYLRAVNRWLTLNFLNDFIDVLDIIVLSLNILDHFVLI